MLVAKYSVSFWTRLKGNLQIRTFAETDLVRKSLAPVLMEDHLIIGCGSNEMKFNYSWLRDHCRCSTCYNTESNQRRIDPIDINPSISPAAVSITNQDKDRNIQITWHNGHVTSYSLQWLSQLHSTIYHRRGENTQRLFWDRQTLESSMPTDVTFEEYMSTDEGVTRHLQNLHKFGIAFMSDVPIKKGALKVIGERIAPLKRTVFGEGDYFPAAQDKLADESYSNGNLPFHTDYSHHHDPNGYTCLHYLQQSKEGGETFVTDALRAARILRESHPEHYEALTTLPVANHKIEKGVRMRCVSTVFDVRIQNHDPEIIRASNIDRAPLELPHRDAQRWYAAWRQWRQITDDPKNVYYFKGTPGRPLFIDNWRLLHGRTAFKGAREVDCVDLSRDRIFNQLRVRLGIDWSLY